MPWLPLFDATLQNHSEPAPLAVFATWCRPAGGISVEGKFTQLVA
jgi:hypothetical protein